MDKTILSKISVKDTEIGIMRVSDVDYTSLTDLAKYQKSSDPSFTVRNWLRKITTIDYLGLWEKMRNENFNLVEFDQIKKERGVNSFALSPRQWIKRVNAVGIISSSGRYSAGTFAHPDIAFEFASWLSPEFKLYLITEFERLKRSEAYQNRIEWKANRLLSKLNYLVQTDAIKTFIVPDLTDSQKHFVYAEEADVLNVALFGMTAKEWREKNPKLAKTGNMRDFASILQLVILNNMQNMNANMIKEGLRQSERLVRLNELAKEQMRLFQDNENIRKLEAL